MVVYQYVGDIYVGGGVSVCGWYICRGCGICYNTLYERLVVIYFRTCNISKIIDWMFDFWDNRG